MIAEKESIAEVRQIQRVQFGILSPDELVSMDLLYYRVNI